MSTSPLFMDDILEIIEDHIVKRLLAQGVTTACRDPEPSNYYNRPCPTRIVHVIHTTSNFEIFDDHVCNGLKKYHYEDPASIDRLNYDLDILAEALIDFQR